MILLLWVFYLVVGRILISVWMKFELPKNIKKSSWIMKLHDCPLCSGVWIYSFLSFTLGVGLLKVAGFGDIPLIIDSIITGILTSWIVWIFILGWHSAYDIVVIE